MLPLPEWQYIALEPHFGIRGLGVDGSPPTDDSNSIGIGMVSYMMVSDMYTLNACVLNGKGLKPCWPLARMKMIVI